MHRYVNKGVNVRYLGGTKGAKDNATIRTIKHRLVRGEVYTICYETKYNNEPGSWHYQFYGTIGHYPPECFTSICDSVGEQYGLK